MSDLGEQLESFATDVPVLLIEGIRAASFGKSVKQALPVPKFMNSCHVQVQGTDAKNKSM